MSTPVLITHWFHATSDSPQEGWVKKFKICDRREVRDGKGSKVLIATNVNIPAGLRMAWKQIGCISVAGYLQALKLVVAQLKWEIISGGGTDAEDLELLRAYDCAVQDRKRKNEKYSDAACRLLVSEGQDIDTADLDPDEAEAW